MNQLKTQDELQFLSAHENRIAIRRSVAEKRRCQEHSRVKEWTDLRQDLAKWKDRVEQIGFSASNTTSFDEPNDKIQISTRCDQPTTDNVWRVLGDMQEELRQLQQRCRLQTEASEWPISDLRLLHDEFTVCYALLDDKRQSLLPSRKFLFSRYRAELARRQQQPLDHLSKLEDKNQLRPSITSSIMEGDNVIQGMNHVDITINQGQYSIVRQTLSENPLATPTGCKTVSNDATSLILCNIEHSKITVRSRLKSLYLSDLSHCQIIQEDQDNVTTVVEGAIHITNCQEVEFHRIHAHQLRIHASVDLHFRANSIVHSGVILEESRRITFYVHPNSKVQWEVKDFGWFQRDRPSPNYTIVLVNYNAEKLIPPKEMSPVEKYLSAEPAFTEASVAATQIHSNDQDDEL